MVSKQRSKPYIRLKGKERGTVWHFASKKELSKWLKENEAIQRQLVAIPGNFFSGRGER